METVLPGKSAMAGLMLPREHGAWGMLALPFLSGLALARRLEWEAAPAAVAALAVFLLREPLVVLLRGAGDRTAARRSAAWYGLALAASGMVLLWRLPPVLIAPLGAIAGTLLALSTYLTVRNRGRSVLLQVASAAGLNGSGVLAWLAVHPELEAKVLWLWGLHFAHSAASLLAVHARLEARIAARQNRDLDAMRRRAAVAQALLVAAAAGLAAAGSRALSLALLLSGGLHAGDLIRLRRPEFLRRPLRRVGLRELAISALYSGLVLAGLW